MDIPVFKIFTFKTYWTIEMPGARLEPAYWHAISTKFMWFWNYSQKQFLVLQILALETLSKNLGIRNNALRAVLSRTPKLFLAKISNTVSGAHENRRSGTTRPSSSSPDTEEILEKFKREYLENRLFRRNFEHCIRSIWQLRWLHDKNARRADLIQR